MSGIIQSKIEAAQDEHVFILIETPGRPAISLDVADTHGRRTLGVRIAGMAVASLLADVEELPPMDGRGVTVRYCPYCGEERNLVSSKTHRCKEVRGHS